MSTISVIIPCYNNEFNIKPTTEELIKTSKLLPQGTEFELVFVDDGSKDGTYRELVNFVNGYKGKCTVVKLISNYGAPNASFCGLKYTTGECIVVIAADLQDPPELIIEMYNKWKAGDCRLIVANRRSRKDGFFKEILSYTYQFFFRKFALKNLPKGGFDLCMFDQKLKDIVLNINEISTHTWYQFLWLNIPFKEIAYDRRERKIGKSMWSLKKRVNFLINTFVSFSHFPIRMISFMGILFGIIAFFYAIFIIIAKLSNQVHVEGWTSLIVLFLFVSSFQFVSLGIIGEYVWRNLELTRKRPNFVVDTVIEKDSK